MTSLNEQVGGAYQVRQEITPSCSGCKHVSTKQVRQLGGIAIIESCSRTGYSAAWERAAMIQGDPPAAVKSLGFNNTRQLFVSDHSNCGPIGKFFEAKS